MSQIIKQRLKPILLFTVVPMLIFDVLFFVVYNLCNEWASAAAAPIAEKQSDFPSLLLNLIDMPHRMFVPTILVFVIMSFVTCYLANFLLPKANNNSMFIRNIKTILIGKVVVTLSVFYFNWYAIAEPLLSSNVGVGEGFTEMEKSFNLYTPIIMVVCYLLVFLTTFLSKED